MALVRAWFYLVWLSWQRQARVRQMVWIALGLLVFSAAFVSIQTASGRWDMHNWRWRDGQTYRHWVNNAQQTTLALPPFSPTNASLNLAAFGAAQAVLDQSPFRVFTNGMILAVYLSFLLPIWSLSFATEALGGERESNNLIWVLSRPIPRPAIYLARFVALLPWCFALNLGGFALLCYLAGPPGRQALDLFWPVIVWTTLAFAALFHLLGAVFRRPAVVAILYVFFLEIILNLMPGYLKRFSISFYARCMMFDVAEDLGIQPDSPSVFLPVTGPTALAVLLGLTAGLLVLGTILFTRTQYQDTV
jgi:ABC-type transport system involved in multi-copper enzyme maturation permease subunit